MDTGDAREPGVPEGERTGVPGLTVRPASLRDVEVLRRWDEDPDVLASDPYDEWEWATELQRSPEWREVWIGELWGRPVGCLQLIDAAEEESHYWGEVERGAWAIDLWIGEAADRSRGHGGELLRFALGRCFGVRGATAVLIDPLESNVRALRFYEREGFVPVGRRWFSRDLCVVHRMERAAWERIAAARARGERGAGR